MSILVTSLPPLPSPAQQVASTASATQHQNASKLVVIDSAGTNLAYKSVAPNSFAEISVVDNVTATTITTAGTPVLFSSILFSVNPLSNGFTLLTNSDLRYDSATTSVFYVVVNATVQSGSNNQKVMLAVYKNGSILGNSKSFQTVSNAQPQNQISTCLVQLAQNDILQVFVSNETAVNNITLTSLGIEIFNVS